MMGISNNVYTIRSLKNTAFSDLGLVKNKCEKLTNDFFQIQFFSRSDGEETIWTISFPESRGIREIFRVAKENA